jgi:hypothetical protein
MSEKREWLETVYSYVLQDLFLMVKARLPESKFPVKKLGFCGNNGCNPHHSRNCLLFAEAVQLLKE